VSVVPLLIAAQLAQVVTRVEPEYTVAAREQGLEGTVVVEFVVDEKGVPSEFMIGLPLGYGLDEMAILAVRQWRYKPPKKDGKPVRVPAQAELYFTRFRTSSNPEKLHDVERAMRVINDPATDHIDKDEAVFTIQRIANEEFGPALYYRALLHRRGLMLAKDNQAFLKNLHAAVGKRYGPALYELASVYQSAELVKQDEPRASQLLDLAAKAGHKYSAKFLAERYAKDDPARAAEYYGLCAIEGDIHCQLRFGQLLIASKAKDPRGVPYGIAWLEVVKAQGDLSPALIIAEEMAAAPELRERVSKLRATIARRLQLPLQ
jgi:TonB family protein